MFAGSHARITGRVVVLHASWTSERETNIDGRLPVTPTSTPVCGSPRRCGGSCRRDPPATRPCASSPEPAESWGRRRTVLPRCASARPASSVRPAAVAPRARCVVELSRGGPVRRALRPRCVAMGRTSRTRVSCDRHSPVRTAPARWPRRIGPPVWLGRSTQRARSVKTFVPPAVALVPSEPNERTDPSSGDMLKGRGKSGTACGGSTRPSE